MEWDEHCQHGVKWQDDQHRKLYDKIETLFNSVLSGVEEKDLFRETVAFIGLYSKEHFAREETYMREHGYPRENFHVTEHQEFTECFSEFVNNYSYNGIESSVELLNKLNEWFFKHTQTTDKYLANFLLKYNIK